MNCTLANLEKNYELELKRIVDKIKKVEAESVLLQLPDGLKPSGPVLVDYLKSESSAEISIWLGECFGACDLPDSDCDLVVQFGHAAW